jgi:hypothetical protein
VNLKVAEVSALEEIVADRAWNFLEWTNSLNVRVILQDCVERNLATSAI